MAWKASGEVGLPFIKEYREWDRVQARERIFRWSGMEIGKPDYARLHHAFLAYDEEMPQRKQSYMLPVGDVIRGRLVVIPEALFSAREYLLHIRDETMLPWQTRKEILFKISQIIRKIDREMPGRVQPWMR